MKTFQLNKVKYEIPSKWSEVRLEQQIAVGEISESEENDVIKRIGLIAGYAGIPIEEIKKTPIAKVKGLFKYLAFINEPLPTKPIGEFEFKGHKYQVMDTMMNQEFQDYVSIETAIQNNKEHPLRALPFIFAIICKRDGESLDDYDLEERAKEFKDLPMDIVEPLRVFFSTFGKISEIGLALSSHPKEILDVKLKELDNTLIRQDSGRLSTRLLVGGMRWWRKFYTRLLEKSFNITLSKSSKTKWKEM